MAWEKGKSANPGGRPKSDRAFTDALRVVARREDQPGKTKIMRLAETLFECAVIDKQGWAFAQIADRLEGKAIQQVDVSVQDNRDMGEYSDAELTAMLKERVIHAPLDDKPPATSDKLN
jgi:hypothetical protein